MVRVTTRTTKKGQRNTSQKCLASINTSTYKMASDYIYKEKTNKNKTTKQYEDGASVRKKNSLFIYSYKEQTHTYSEKNFGPEFSFFKVQHRFELRLNPLKS